MEDEMKLHLLRELYVKNNIPEDKMHQALDFIILLNSQITLDLDVIDEGFLDSLIVFMVKNNLNSVDNFIILMRYYHVLDRKDLFIHLTKYTGMLNVMENIIKRLINLKGEEKAKEILRGFKTPHLGVHPQRLPEYANEITTLLDNSLSKEETEIVLAGNNHNVSKEAQIPEKVEYENSSSLKDYLKSRHARKVAELKKHMEENRVWFEQVITQEVVDFVASNPEVLSGVIEDNKLYITKIPYDTKAYLEAKDNISKKYYGCHCPFAREAIKTEGTKVSGRFCYCSAGFAKFPFEVILDQKLKIKVLQSILMGDDICRFAIDLEGINYKK
jgi:hypothetical protein